ncbi:hypothetical protein X975_01757, partial [Stegodyphus mimosarum]
FLKLEVLELCEKFLLCSSTHFELF